MSDGTAEYWLDRAQAERDRAERFARALQVIRDSNRHATFCTATRARKGRARVPCSPGCPVAIAAEALGARGTL